MLEMAGFFFSPHLNVIEGFHRKLGLAFGGSPVILSVFDGFCRGKGGKSVIKAS